MSRICSYCGSNKRVNFSKKYNDLLCHNHYMQYYHTGKLKDRFRNSCNKYEIIDDKYAEIILVDVDCQETARVKIDISDIDKCKKYKWHKHSQGYASASTSNGKIILLHQFIMDLYTKEKIVDHINRDRMDNRKQNLRAADYSKNNMNQKLRSTNISGTKGVSKVKNSETWHAYIGINKKRINLGYFDTYEKARDARIEAERKYYGEFSLYRN